MAAAKSQQISPVTKCKYTASVDIQMHSVKIVTYSLSYATEAQWMGMREENIAI